MFAAEFLMSMRLFQQSIKQKDPTIENMMACAEEYRTSLTSPAIRFIELSVHGTIIVLSKAGYIKWWRPKLDGSHPWIQTGMSLHSESLATPIFITCEVIANIHKIHILK